MESIHILLLGYGFDNLGLGNVFRKWQLNQDSIDGFVGVELNYPVQDFLL